jgi:hypothetical protein
MARKACHRVVVAVFVAAWGTARDDSALSAIVGADKWHREFCGTRCGG